LDLPGFLKQFITPIVKVSKGRKTETFFTLPEFQTWLKRVGNNGKGWSVKYYKGLGTSTSAEAKEYFSNLDLHEVEFAKISQDYFEAPAGGKENAWNTIESTGSDLIDMVFRKERVEDRKLWLNHTSKDCFMDYIQASQSGGVKYSEFVNKEFVQFSHYDNERSIPHVIDGFKPSQRKVLYACFKRNLKNEIKVAQLTGYVAEHSAYHHGEVSLQQTIIGLAQNFCGANNINLLTPSGQFGTRRMGGKDAASARYIFTSLEPVARAIFHPDDDELLTYLNDDGSSGIGTGWSSKVCNYNPRDVISNLRLMIAGEEHLPELKPFYAGFTGEVRAFSIQCRDALVRCILIFRFFVDLHADCAREATELYSLRQNRTHQRFDAFHFGTTGWQMDSGLQGIPGEDVPSSRDKSQGKGSCC
jgi:DNA topoisomerase-2